MTIYLNDYIGSNVLVPFGKQGEYGKEVAYDFSAWTARFGEGTIGWEIKRSADTNAYLLPSTEDGNVSVVTLTETETEYAGRGCLEVFYVNAGETEKRISETFNFNILPSLQDTGEAPSPWQSYVDAVHADALAAEEAASSVLDLTATATVDANVGTPSVSVEVTTEEDHKNMAFAFSNIKGEQGEQGETGNGISSVSVAKTATVGNVDTYTMTVNYTDGDSDTATFDVTNGEVTEEEFEKAFPTDTANGSIASYPDGADMPVKDLKVAVTPVQDLHGYANPWVGGAGVNQWDEEWELGVWNSSGVKADSSNAVRSKNYIPVLPNTQYYVYYSYAPSKKLIFREYDANKSFVGTKTSVAGLTTFDVGVYFVTFCTASVDAITSLSHDISINYPSTVTTYSPYSNICPITGWTGANVVRTGVNVWDEQWEVGFIDQTTGANASSSTNIRSKNYIPVLPNTQYYAYNGTIATVAWFTVRYYDADKNYIGDTNADGVHPYWNNNNLHPVVTPPNAFYMRFVTNSTIYPATYNNDISINYPSTDHEYHAYSGNTYSIPFGQTVYGGTLDVTTGVLTVDRAMVDLGTLTFSLMNNTSARQAWHRVFNDAKQIGANSVINAISSQYVAVSANATWKAGDMAFDTGNTSFIAFCVESGKYADHTEFESAMSGVQFCYELATPQSVQLTPTEVKSLLGNNNVFADCGDSEVEYLADVTLYIQKLTGSTEDDMVANANIANNKYFMVGNRLFFSTSAIAQGASIIVGTNCTETNLADALNALNS